ncbi:MAG: DUF4249 domain-containing protein [Bacteroidota bacterium]
MRNLSYIILIFLVLTACEKVIDVDLEESDPQIVIEANLQAGEHDFVVNISETADYFDNQLPTSIEAAAVRLVAEDGTITMIPWSSSGQYRTTMTAMPKQTYRLEVQIGEALYQASSFLPERVALLNLETEFQEARGPLDEGYLVFSRFQDDGAVDNYYRFLHSVDGVLQNDGDDLQVSDDNFFNGGTARLPLFQKIFNPGEEIELILQHFDAASFDYFNSLADIVSSGDGAAGGSAAPGNPNTNWSNGALGYFSAFSSDTLSIQIPE